MIRSMIILFLGACCCHWTTAAEFSHGNYILNIDDGTLRSVKATGESGDLDLSGLRIKKIAENVFDDLLNLKSLNLSNNQLQELPPLIFSKLINLERLSLASNRVQRFDRNFVGLNHLKLLDISNNSLRVLDKGDFFGLTKLTSIMVEGNAIGSLPANIFRDPSLPDSQNPNRMTPGSPDVSVPYEEYLEIPPLPEGIDIKICKTNDGIVESVDELQETEELNGCSKAVIIRENRVLDFSGLGITKFLRGWYKLGGFFFSGINLSTNSITEITPELLNDLPPGLNYVNLRNNRINIIRKNIINNPRLDEINLANNFLTAIEDGAFENTELSSLSLQNNRLKNLVFSRKLPATLEKLDVSENEISYIPHDSFVNLKKLRNLDLSRNNLTNLSGDTFRGLNQLYSIDLSHNHLGGVEPGTFEDQERMVNLRLNNNLISELKRGSLRGLVQLKFLHLQYNKLTTISRESFADLKYKYGYLIYLTNNEISKVEQGSFDDVAVYELDMSHNKLSENSIQRGAFNTSTLHRLVLNDNLFTAINGDSFYGAPELYQLFIGNNNITSIKKGAAKNLKSLFNLSLSNNPIEILENGALWGLLTAYVNLENVPIKIIQGGLFDDA